MKVSEKIMSEREWRVFFIIIFFIIFLNGLAEMKLQRDWEKKDTTPSSKNIKIVIDSSELIEIKINK
jgi:hypothetical protein